ncbi:hypothetical protein PHMEG_00033082 [Phytophthora megakarya]|uniref:Uncharacterized protein n=1 Tax=Phytophthora megakarya TaxID=4795 RepID=A0A225UUL2_9STRA|nr:hypothetical protein PHMEG_00033082 [Phytophthora megakarya]
MQVKQSTFKAARQRLIAADDSSTASESNGEEHSDEEKATVNQNKRKNEVQEPSPPRKAPKTTENSLNEAPEALFETNAAVEVELELLAIESRRLDFEVIKWKQQQALRRQTLQLKCEEINLKGATTKQQQQTQEMEIRAKLIKALDEAGTAVTQVREYLALLEG